MAGGMLGRSRYGCQRLKAHTGCLFWSMRQTRPYVLPQRVTDLELVHVEDVVGRSQPVCERDWNTLQKPSAHM